MTVALRSKLPPAPPPLAIADIAWVAGVLDLKATIIRKKNKERSTPQLVLCVETKEYEVIRGLSALTGTSPELQAEKLSPDWMRRLCVEHCPEKHVHGSNEANETYPWKLPATGRWTITGAGAAVILWSTLGFQRNKRDMPEALEAMLAYAKTTGQGWGATRTSLLRLRNLGWRMPDRFEAALRDHFEDA